MFNGTAGVADESYRAFGVAQTTEGSAGIPIAVDLTFNERAAHITATAIATDGTARVAEGLAWMVPEVGWQIASTAVSCALTIEDGKVVVFTVNAGLEASWAAQLSISFTQNYSAEGLPA